MWGWNLGIKFFIIKCLTDRRSASIEKLLNLVKTTMTGQLVVRKPLTSWLDSMKRVALIGDACHPMFVLKTAQYNSLSI
jgi:hypothetical protein